MWAQKIGNHGFSPRLDSFKEMTQELAEQNAEQMGDPTLAKLGKTRLQRFLNRHLKVSPTPGSSPDRHSALSGSSGSIIDYLHMLKQVLMEYNFLPENIYSMDRQGFTLGMLNCAKVICRAGKAPSTSKAI